ncbi:hypothetical protein [Lonepinella sp. BR2271]|uniref:hypothetical protein n=1 Tax=Lonepinella sp. BR2271 TaxID=3434550 RepID=UPI003F6DCF86
MKKIFSLLCLVLSTQVYSYSDTIKFNARGVTINGETPPKETCILTFKDTPKQFAQCLVKYAKDQTTFGCPDDFKMETIGRTCLQLTNTDPDNIGDIDYEIDDGE